MQPLPLDPLLHLPLFPSLGEMSLSLYRPAYADFGSRFDHIFNEMCQMNTRISCIAYQQSRLDSFAPSPSPKLTGESFSSGDDVDGTDGSSSSSDDEMMSSH